MGAKAEAFSYCALIWWLWTLANQDGTILLQRREQHFQVSLVLASI
jgi:hypothetical protein